MSKYIDADALKKEIQDMDNITGHDSWTAEGKHKAYAEIVASIIRMPAADVESVRHGKWIKTDADFNDMPMEEFKCSMCGNLAHNLTDTTIPLPEFCDKCGAKMDGGEKND